MAEARSSDTTRVAIMQKPDSAEEELGILRRMNGNGDYEGIAKRQPKL